jgi:peptidoglycan/xylan/chitin deacetylase (PgdA/CDA1 family)
MMRALAIMYHDVVERGDYAASGFAGEDAHIYKLGRQDFASHLRAIAAVASGSIAVLAGRRQWSEPPPVFLTFDDGGASACPLVADMLEQHGWKGHFFITTNRIGEAGFLDEVRIRELDARGHVVGSHSHTHPTRMAATRPAEMDREWRVSLDLLAGIVGRPVTVASLPGGYYSRQVGQAAASAGIEVLFTSEPTAAVTAVDGCLVLGRYAVKRGMGPEWPAGFASNQRSFCWRQTALWKAKRLAKALGGEAYVKARKSILER